MGEITDFEDGILRFFASISSKAKRNFKKNYRKESKVTNIPFRPMGKILNSGKMRMQNWKRRSKN